MLMQSDLAVQLKGLSDLTVQIGVKVDALKASGQQVSPEVEAATADLVAKMNDLASKLPDAA